MNKEKFINLMKEAQDYDKLIDELPSIINFDHPIFEFGWKMFDKIIKIYFTEEGQDWINYYLFELPYVTDEFAHCWDENGKEIPLKTLDDLWELVKTCINDNFNI